MKLAYFMNQSEFIMPVAPGDVVMVFDIHETILVEKILTGLLYECSPENAEHIQKVLNYILVTPPEGGLQ